MPGCSSNSPIHVRISDRRLRKSVTRVRAQVGQLLKWRAGLIGKGRLGGTLSHPGNGFPDQGVFGAEMAKEGDFVDACLGGNAAGRGPAVSGFGEDACGGGEQLVPKVHARRV